MCTADDLGLISIRGAEIEYVKDETGEVIGERESDGMSGCSRFVACWPLGVCLLLALLFSCRQHSTANRRQANVLRLPGRRSVPGKILVPETALLSQSFPSRVRLQIDMTKMADEDAADVYSSFNL